MRHLIDNYKNTNNRNMKTDCINVLNAFKKKKKYA